MFQCMFTCEQFMLRFVTAHQCRERKKIRSYKQNVRRQHQHLPSSERDGACAQDGFRSRDRDGASFSVRRGGRVRRGRFSALRRTRATTATFPLGHHRLGWQPRGQQRRGLAGARGSGPRTRRARGRTSPSRLAPPARREMASSARVRRKIKSRADESPHPSHVTSSRTRPLDARPHGRRGTTHAQGTIDRRDFRRPRDEEAPTSSPPFSTAPSRRATRV